jgi:geranylgeranyl diphosphate synthase type II
MNKFEYAHIDLESALKQSFERLTRSNTTNVPSRLLESMAYSLFSPGKRIRPRLALASGKLLNLPVAVTLPAALALEFVHCYTLIHDDLPCMDNDDYRRGRPSNHKQFDEATALLAGSSLASLAIDSLFEAGQHVQPQKLLAALRRLNWAMGPHGVVGGQAAELEFSQNSTLQDLRQMHARKTGALFTAALLLPADLAGIDLSSNPGKSLVEFASALGLAFQVADDLDDILQDQTRVLLHDQPQTHVAPNNILFYLPVEDARMITNDMLTRAMHGMISTWSSEADHLVSIAEEVAKKLRPED